jgi:hypothetical protein
MWKNRGTDAKAFVGLRTMSKVYAVLLVVVALITMAAIGTLALVVVTDVGYLAYRVLKPGMTP